MGGCRRPSGVGDGAKAGVKGQLGRGEYRRKGKVLNAMNPNSPQNAKYIQQDRWLVTVVASHNLWCDCQDYRQHIPGWPGDGDAAGTGAAGAGTQGGDSAAAAVSPTDSELVAVDFDLRIAEDTEEEAG